jgi:DNA-directed RNA polymerase alpha subunit
MSCFCWLGCKRKTSHSLVSSKRLSAIREHEKQGFRVQKYYFQDDALRIEMTRNDVAAAHADIAGQRKNLDKSIEDFVLSVRTYNSLKTGGFRTIRDIVQKKEEELLRTKNFGRKCLHEIKAIIEPMGLSIGMKIE